MIKLKQTDTIQSSIDAHQSNMSALAKATGHETTQEKKPNYRLRRAVAATALTAGLGILPQAVSMIGAGGDHLVEAGGNVVDHVFDDPNFGPEEPNQEQIGHMRRHGHGADNQLANDSNK